MGQPSVGLEHLEIGNPHFFFIAGNQNDSLSFPFEGNIGFPFSERFAIQFELDSGLGAVCANNHLVAAIGSNFNWDRAPHAAP